MALWVELGAYMQRVGIARGLCLGLEHRGELERFVVLTFSRAGERTPVSDLGRRDGALQGGKSALRRMGLEVNVCSKALGDGCDFAGLGEDACSFG